MKTISFRLPDELAEWLREKAAGETIRRKKYVSINVLVAEMFRREMEAEVREDASDAWEQIALEADELTRALENKEITLKEFNGSIKALKRRLSGAKGEMKSIRDKSKADGEKEGQAKPTAKRRD